MSTVGLLLNRQTFLEVLHITKAELINVRNRLGFLTYISFSVLRKKVLN